MLSWLLPLLIGLVAFAVGGFGLFLWWPARREKAQKISLGLSLLTGAFLTLALLVFQVVLDNALRASDRRDAQRALQVSLTSSPTLAGVDLAGRRLDGFFLQAKDLTGARLAGASLRRSQLGRARLEGADLTRAHLEDARLERARLSFANLEGAWLTDAKLDFAILTSARLRGAHLRRARFTVAKLDADLRAADLEGANLSGADLAPANLKGAKLKAVVLDDANLEGADARGTDFSVVKSAKRANFSYVRYDARTRWPPHLANPPAPCHQASCRTGIAGERPDATIFRTLRSVAELLRGRTPPRWTRQLDPFGLTYTAPGEEASLSVEAIRLPSPQAPLDFAHGYDEDLRSFGGYKQRALRLAGRADRRVAVRWYSYGRAERVSAIDVYDVVAQTGYIFIAQAPTEAFLLYRRDFKALFDALGVMPNPALTSPGE